MSDIKKSERAESKLEVIHGAYAIRMAVTNLAENSFYITLSKVEDKINSRIKGLEEKEQNRIRESMYKFYRSQIDRVSNNVIELATGISRHLRIANTIFPTYMSEFEERRLEMDRAMACCNALQDELQYAGECLYADLNKYMNLALQIQKEFNMIKSLRQTDNRFLKNKKIVGNLCMSFLLRILLMSTTMAMLTITVQRTLAGFVLISQPMQFYMD